jgi:hypothetical protein
MTAITQYENACNKILKAFTKKQGLDDYGWIAEEIGGTVSFGDDYFFDMREMIIDLKTDQPKGLILKWQEESTEFNCYRGDKMYVSYEAYTKGARFEEEYQPRAFKPLDIIKDLNDQFPIV